MGVSGSLAARAATRQSSWCASLRPFGMEMFEAMAQGDVDGLFGDTVCWWVEL